MRSAGAVAAFALLAALTGGAAWRIVRDAWPGRPIHETLVRVAVAGFALIAATGLVLGAIGWLTLAGYTAAAIAIASVTVRADLLEDPFDGRVPFHPAVAFALPTLALVTAYGLTHPPVDYDSLTYHLFLPARWLQMHRLWIVPVPFGDEAAAYTPINTELFYAWLMAPFSGDTLARVGQIPFLVVAGVALYGLARRLGARPSGALYAPAFLFAARPFVEEALGESVDVAATAMFWTTVLLGLIAVQSRRRADVILWGVAFGLFVGIKYTALIYAPVLILLVLPEIGIGRAVWALPGTIALGLPCYLRNWIVAGSPIFPATLAIGRLTLAPGAYATKAMVDSPFHATGSTAFFQLVVAAFDAPLLYVWAPLALLGVIAIGRARRWRAAALLVFVPALLAVMEWTLIPYNNQARFLLPAVAPAIALIPFAFELGDALAPVLHVACGVSLPVLVGISGPPIVDRPYLPIAAALAALAVAGFRVAKGRITAAAIGLAAAASITAAASIRVCPPDGCNFITPDPPMFPFVRPTFFDGWAWVEAHAHGARIAYAGNNIPYRLLGRHLENEVYYVNINGRPDWRYHDYVRQLRKSSVRFRQARDPNTYYERDGADEQAWIDNLIADRTDYLFVSRLSVFTVDHMWHDAARFPIEDLWARTDPSRFTLEHENTEVKIYAVNRPGTSRARLAAR